MGLEELMARAKARAHIAAARERRVKRSKEQKTERIRQTAAQGSKNGAAAILKFAAVSCKISTHGQQVQIPDCVLDNVMAKLASCLEPGGVYGPALVARDLANASLVCSEFYASAKYGFSVLSSLIEQQLQQRLHKQALPPAPSAWLGEKAKQQYSTAVSLSDGINLPGPLGWPFWERVITDPLSVQLHDLEAAARQMGIIDLAPVLHSGPAAAAAAAAALPGAAVPQAAAATAVDHHAGLQAALAPDAAAAAAAAVQHQGVQLQGVQSPPAAATTTATAATTKHKARLIRRLLKCFGLTKPLPVPVPAAVQDKQLAGEAVSQAIHTAAAAAAAASIVSPVGPTAEAAAAAAQTGPLAAAAGDTAVSYPRAALLRALTLERCCPIIAWDGADQCTALTAAVNQLARLHCSTVARANLHLGTRGCLSSLRLELVTAGVTSMQQLQALLAHEKAAAEARKMQRQLQQEREKQQKEQKKRVAAAALSPPPKKGRAFSLNSIGIKPKEDDPTFI